MKTIWNGIEKTVINSMLCQVVLYNTSPVLRGQKAGKGPLYIYFDQYNSSEVSEYREKVILGY